MSVVVRLTRGSIPRRPGDTTGRLWRRRRDAVIALAHHSGASQKLIADAFDLSPRRVQEILAELADVQAEAAPRPPARTSGSAGRGSGTLKIRCKKHNLTRFPAPTSQRKWITLLKIASK